MCEVTFLDTGVVVGYCIRQDRHHRNCREYLESEIPEGGAFVGPTVRDEYEHTKQTVTRRLSRGVRDHVRDVRRDDCSGQLGPIDLNHLKSNVLNRGNDSYGFLYDYYHNELGNYVQKDELVQQLREMARDIESLPPTREPQFEELVADWTPRENHESVESSLSIITDTNDRSICVEAHDLACHTEEDVEFATVNPQDFVDDGVEQAILDITSLSGIRDLSNRR
jgi:hypothetical protein